MKPAFRPYTPSDFIAVRDFLVDSYAAFDPPHNWMIDRWQFVASVGRVFNGLTVEAWAAAIGLWVAQGGAIVAMANEEEGKGDVFFQAARPDTLTRGLLEEMFAFAESNCLRPKRTDPGSTGFKVHVPAADTLVAQMCADRGYARLTGNEDITQRPLTGTDPVVLPQGYRIVDGSAATPLQKADAHARAFGYHTDLEFVSKQGVEGFTLLQSMPDYRPEFDLAVVGERGIIDAFCGIWVDTENRIAVLEPVGTSYDCRRKGLARAAIYEACNRAHRAGATRAYVGSNIAFYQSVGFRLVTSLSLWEHRALRCSA